MLQEFVHDLRVQAVFVNPFVYKKEANKPFQTVIKFGYSNIEGIYIAYTNGQ